jgi:hypothetical protein
MNCWAFLTFAIFARQNSPVELRAQQDLSSDVGVGPLRSVGNEGERGQVNERGIGCD